MDQSTERRSYRAMRHEVEPVPVARLRGADLLLVLWSALFGSCFTALALIGLFGGRFLNAICGG